MQRAREKEKEKKNPNNNNNKRAGRPAGCRDRAGGRQGQGKTPCSAELLVVNIEPLTNARQTQTKENTHTHPHREYRVSTIPEHAWLHIPS